MKIVAITACTAGIAHTYIAKEKLIQAARALGHDIRVETQGSIGVEDELRPEEIQAADVVLLASDISLSGRERFKGKRIVEVPVSYVVKSPKAIIGKIEERLKEK